MPDREPEASFSSVLDEALRRRAMSLTQLRDALTEVGHPVSLATLSYWRAGLREPERRRSLEAVPEIERLLGLPAGRLSAHVHRRGEPRPQAFDRLVGRPMSEGLVGEGDVDRTLFHLVVDVGPDRAIVRAQVRQMFVARRAGVKGVTIFVGPDDGTEDNSAVLRPLAGCTIGELRDVEHGITATRLQFERALVAGEAVMAEYEVLTLDGPDLETEYGLVAEQRLEEAMVWIRFHPDCLPARSWVWFDEDDLRHAWPVDMAGSTGLSYRQLAFGPGSLGARWEW